MSYSGTLTNSFGNWWIDTLVVTGKSNGRGEAGRLSVGFCTSISAGKLRASLVEFRRRTPLVELATYASGGGRLV